MFSTARDAETRRQRNTAALVFTLIIAGIVAMVVLGQEMAPASGEAPQITLPVSSLVLASIIPLVLIAIALVSIGVLKEDGRKYRR